MSRHEASLLTRARGLSQKTSIFCTFSFLLAITLGVAAQNPPTPKSFLGFEPTEERTIADWGQIVDYFNKLDKGSDRVLVREFGKSTLGRPMVAAFISDPANLKNLDEYRRINEKLANPATIKDPKELEELIRKARAIVSISCSIHSTEIVASQMSMNLAYQLSSAKDEGTREILRNTIVILIPSSNPDGIDIVANWYRKTLGTKSEGSAPPELYHHYAGHDNNRDWFMMNLQETRNITKLYWREWYPQFVYDVHQMGQNGARFVIPPFFDPPYPRIDPTVLREAGLVGYKMATDLQATGVKGVATNTTFDMWWHGGFRTAPYYHNSVGILSEAASADLMTPITVKKETLKNQRQQRGLNSPLENTIAHPDPWEGGKWGPREIAAIEMTASRALLELASKFRERYVRQFHDLGAKNLKPKEGEPAAFVITAGQPNGETISRMLEILMWQGIEVHAMTAEGHFAKDREKPNQHEDTPLGSFLVYVNQAQKNNILALFERQVYPNRVNSAGEAEVPYDVAGWTLPLQMGVDYETVWDIKDSARFRGTLKKISDINEARAVMNLPAASGSFAKFKNPLKTSVRVGLYKGNVGSMDEGWTRLVFDNFQIPYKTVTDEDIKSGTIDVDTLILPADSEATILKGLSRDRYPEEISGGIGEGGATNLKKFVEGGGRLICFDDACELVIKRLNLPIKNVLSGLRRNEFYNPGSIVKLTVNRDHPYSSGLGDEVPAYFTNSSAFEVMTQASNIRTVASYAQSGALMSGWMLGENHLNGKSALIEASHGAGRVILFAFRPQHRGQSFATFPFIFNAIEK